PQLLRQTELQLQQLDDLSALAEASDNPSRLRAIGEELAELRSRDGRRTEPGAAQVGSKRGGRRPTRAKPTTADHGEGRVMKSRTPDGIEVLVGTSSRGNDIVTSRLAAAEDLWFHARGVAGA